MKKRMVRLAFIAIVGTLSSFAFGDSFDNKFFDVARQVTSQPDDIEMLRYFIYHEEHATYVYAKVSSQDYVFDGILVAAKLARNQKIPGTSLTFSEGTCMEPINLFNAVFAKSDGFVDKYGSNTSVKAYLKANTAEAKSDAAAQLSANLPYFDGIPHICHFTFNTNFQQEKRVAEIVTGVATGLKDAYRALKSGDVVGGVDKLVALGLPASVACNLIDDYAAGGLIERTPVLGDLALGACKGFVGKVVGFVGDVGSDVMTGINDVGDWLSGQEKNMPGQQYYELYWKPRIPEGMAAIRTSAGIQPLADSIYGPCVDYFDSHTMSSDSANETCTFQRDRQFTPDVAARVAVEDQSLPQWLKASSAAWFQACQDDTCRSEIEVLRQHALAQGRDLIEHRLDLSWEGIQNALSFYGNAASDAAQRSRQRIRSADKSMTANAATGYKELSLGVWTPQCLDEICVGEVKGYASAEASALNHLQQNQPDLSPLAVSKQILPEFGKKFAKAIQDSKNRKILRDPNAKPADKLPILGCKYFLGRSGQWVCPDERTFASCKPYVGLGAATLCLDSADKAAIAEPSYAARQLRGNGCTFQRIVARGPIVAKNGANTPRSTYRLICPTQLGKDLCREYQRGGMTLNCDAGFRQAR